MKTVLLIAFHYPPLSGSSGIQRALRFAEQLPEFGWTPVVLTAHTRAYEKTGSGFDASIEAHTIRAFALDAARHLSIAGRYPAFIARPDRWASWWLGAVPAGIAAIRKYRPSAIWSTYPIATAHVIGHTLQRLSGIPWIADFRDPMAHDGYPPDRSTWRAFEHVEKKVFTRAAAATFTTPGCLRLYRERYRWNDSRLHLIPNGYDEDSFFAASARPSPVPVAEGTRVLLHSGIVYPEWRNPQMLFRALRTLIDQRVPGADTIVMRFRAPVHTQFLRDMAAKEGVTEQLDIQPETEYLDALAEMRAAQGLLLLQSAGCNDQIPAKIYEYFRAQRPILAAVALNGDSAALIEEQGQHIVADIASADAIAEALRSWLTMPEHDNLPLDPSITRHSRLERSRQLALLLDHTSS